MIQGLRKEGMRGFSTMVKEISHRIILNDGHKMPLFGLGTWQTKDDVAAYNGVALALNEGYRLVDTAACYNNEIPVGQALRDSGLKRDDYFLVTKLDPYLHGFKEAKNSLEISLEKLGLNYIDLFLIHTPRPGRIVETWKAFVELKKEGKTKSIGVSNFSGEHIAGLMTHGMEKPAVNQIELHPLNQQLSTVSYCQGNNIALMGYCPLARCQMFDEGRVPAVDAISSKLKKTKAQVLLRWSVQSNFITIPKSSNPGRIKDNANIFSWTLDEDDMGSLSRVNEDLNVSYAGDVMKTRTWDSLKDLDDKGEWV